MEKQKIISQFELIGQEKLYAIIDAFYRRVAKDPDLAPIFPNEFKEVARKQKQFMTQFLGGPPLYSEEHGHPRLRMRHLPFPVTPKRANAWLTCMKEAMDEVGFDGPERESFFARLIMTAHHMVNTPDEDDEFEKGEFQ